MRSGKDRPEGGVPLVVGIDARVCLTDRRGWARYAREFISSAGAIDGLQLKVLVPDSRDAALWFEGLQPPHSVVAVPFRPASPDTYWDAGSRPPEDLLGPMDLFHSLCRFIPPTTVRPVLATVHDLVPLVTPPFKLEYRQATVRALETLHRPYCWTAAISGQTKSELTRIGGIDGRRIRVIHLGASGMFRRGGIPRKPGNVLPPNLEDRPYFIYVGGAGKNKNLQNLMTAFEEVHHRSGAGLVLVGDLSWEYSDFITADGLPSWAGLVGYVDEEDLRALYRGALALVLPSFHEGFGLPIIEAMASGIPVACSDIAVFREIASEAALYFDPHDHGTISRSVLKLVRDPALRLELARLGRVRAAPFNWERTAQLTMDYYQYIRARAYDTREKVPGDRHEQKILPEGC